VSFQLNQLSIDKLKKIRLFLLDLDGTVYLDDLLIPGVREFVLELKKKEIPYIFLTNNSSRSANEYVSKLNNLGIPLSHDNVLTSGQATAIYLAEKKKNASLFVLGTDSLKKELMDYGFLIEDGSDRVDYVIAAFDTELSYQKLVKACRLLDDGAGFIATNPDLVCPRLDKHYIPDCGSICLLLENATGRQPVFIGKPHTKMIEIIRKKFPVSPDKIAIVGDRLYTDIALGCNAGIMTVCVLSGESTLQDISKSAYKPDIVIDSINILNEIF